MANTCLKPARFKDTIYRYSKSLTPKYIIQRHTRPKEGSFNEKTTCQHPSGFDFPHRATPASAYDPYEPILIATVERDGHSVRFYANISNGFNRVTAMYEAFDYAKGTTATVSLENEISLAAGGDRGETVVIDDPNSNITVKPGRWNGGIVSRSPNPVFKVTAGSLTLSGLTTHAQYLIEASGDGTHVAVENCKVISGGEQNLCIQVSGGASLRVADSNISKYHTAIEVIGSPVSRTTAVIEGWTSQAILADEYAVSVTDGASISVSGNTLLQADDSMGGCGLYVDSSSSALLSGGRYKGTYYGSERGGAVRCEGALTIGGLLKEGFTFYDESGKAVGDDTLASQQLSGSQTYSVGQLSDDDNNPVAIVTTADGRKTQFFADKYGGATGALCAAWEYADNGGSASLLLVRSVTYADFSPLQLISGGSLTLNMMSGVTLANNTNYINELIQLTSGTLRIESGNLSSADKTAVRVVDGELEVCGGSIAVTGAANAILAHRGAMVNITGGQISLDGCNKDGYAAVYAEAGSSVGIAGGEISLTGCAGNDCAAVYAEAGSTVGISGGEVSLSDCTGEGCAAVYAAQPGAVQLYGGVFNSSGTAFKTTGSVKDMLASNFFFYRGEEGSEKLVENEAELSASFLGNNERFTVLMGQHGQVVASVTTDDGTRNFTMDGQTAEQALAAAIDYADSCGESKVTLQRSVELTQPLRVYGNDTVLTLVMAGSSELTMQSAAEGVIQVLNGELVLDGGIIRAGGEGAVGVKMSGDSRVRVTGCEIDAGSASGSVAVSVADDAHLELTGGELLGETGVRLERSERASTLTISDLAYVNGSAYGIYAKSGSINFTGGLVNSGGCGIYLNSTSSVSLTMSSGATVVAKGSGEAVGVLLSSVAEAVIGGGASIEASSTGGRAYGVSQASGKLTVTGSASVSAASGSGQACGAFLTGGEAAISGGSFEGSSSVSGSASGLGVGANATLSLTGGSFTASGGYAVTAFAEGDDVGRLLGEGCAYFDSNGKPIAETSVQHLGENAGVTVKSGTSTGVDVAILETGVESKTYTTDDYDTPFDALKQAFANANGKTATLTLLTSVEADELITISGENTNLTLKMVDGAVLSGTDKVVSGSSVSVGLLSVTDGGTLTFASGTINGTLQNKNSRLISVAHSDFNMTGGQINCKCSGSSQSVVYAISNLDHIITMSGGELNLTGEAVASADDANYGMFIEKCYLDITGGRITSDDAGVFLFESEAYIGGTAEIRAKTSAIKTYDNKQLDLYGDAVIQSSGKGLDATGSSYTNVYGSVNITGSEYGIILTKFLTKYGSLNVSEQPVIAGITALRVEDGSATLSGGSYVSLGASDCVTVAEGKTVAGLLAKGYLYFTPDGAEIEVEDTATSLPAQMAVVKSEDAGELSGSVEITGELRFDETLSVDITGIETEDPVTLAYRWYRCNDGRGTGAALVGSGDKYTLTAADIGKYIKVTVTAANVVGILSDTTSSAVKKAVNDSTPHVTVGYGGITGVYATMEYADNSGFAGAKTCPEGSISGLAGGTYFVRYKETATHEAGAAVKVTVLSEAPIQTLTVNGDKIVADGKYNPDKLPDKVSYDTRYNTLTVSGTTLDAADFVLVGSTTLLFTGSGNSITNLSAVAGGTLNIQGKASLALESSDGKTYEVSGELTTGGTAYRFYGSVNGGWAGITYVGNEGAVSGSYALSGDAAVIRAGDTLTVPAGAQLTNNLTLTNNGTLIIENMNSISGSGTISGGRNIILDPGAARLTISLPQSTVYDGKTDYAAQISLVLKDKLVIQGTEFEFDASGWTMQLTRDGKAVTSAVDEGLYTVVFSRGGVSVGPACFSVTRVNLPDAMSYPVVVEPSEHGSVTASSDWAVVGSEVTLTVTPDEGWRLGSLSAVGPDGAQLALRSLGGGKYAFTMPGGKVTVSAVFVRGEGLGFTDVAPGAWYYDAVAYVSENGLMNGVDTGIFDPDGSLTRAMVWTILARIEGADTEGGETWYAKARDWAMETGVSDGTDAMGAITREQLVTMLWRSRGEPGVDFLLTARDADSISSWAYEAMRWAVSEGIIEGDENGFISPAATATRAQAAAIIMRFIEGAK